MKRQAPEGSTTSGPSRKRARSLAESYKRVGTIAEGQYGVVFRGELREKAAPPTATTSSRWVALKQLKLGDVEEGFPVTALREMAALKSLSHPNVVRLLEVVVGATMDEVFMVLEHHPHDLKGILTAHGADAFTPPQIRSLAFGILSGLAYVHASFLLHRDIKPANLLYGADGRVLLADFGLVRPYGDPPPDVLSPNVVTLWYRAPELFFSPETYGPPVDVWSAGAVLVELLTGSPLANAESESSYIRKLCLILGSPSEDSWPGFASLSNAHAHVLPNQTENYLANRVSDPCGGDQGLIDFISSLLTWDPSARLSANQAALHPALEESLRTPLSDMPVFPK